MCLKGAENRAKLRIAIGRFAPASIYLFVNLSLKARLKRGIRNGINEGHSSGLVVGFVGKRRPVPDEKDRTPRRR